MAQADAKTLTDFDKLWNFSQPAETESKFKDLIAEAKKSKDTDYYLQLLTQIARTQGLQRKFDEAHKTLDEVQTALGPQTQKAEVRYWLERGRVFNSSKKAEQAMPAFIKSFDLASGRGFENWAVDAAHMIAIAETQPEKQIEWNLKALSTAEKSKDQKARDWLGSLYNNLGWTYHDAGQFEKALDFFQKALVFRQLKEDSSAIRIAKWAVARTYRSMKKYDEAIAIQTDLEKEFEKIGEKDGYVFEELGELHLATAKSALSKKYFASAYQELSKDAWFKDNEAKRLQRMKELAGL